MIIGPLGITQVDMVWPTVMPWVEQACLKARSNRSPVTLYAQCRNGSLWLAVAATGDSLEQVVGVIITDFLEIGGQRVAQHVIVAGQGDTDGWLDEMVHWPWLAQMGAKRVISEGRPGWLKRLQPYAPDIRAVRTVVEWTVPEVRANGRSEAA
jgi:hypothetical protein